MSEQEMEVEDYSLKKEKKKKKRKERKPIDMKIEMVEGDKNKIAPLVGYFPTGYVPKVEEEDGDDDKKDDVTVYRHKHKDKRSRLELVVKSKGSNVNFVGTNYSGENNAPMPCQYALGILDKETQTLQIVKIESNKIFRLEPRFPGKDEVSMEGVEDATRIFSTKKQIKKIKEREKLNKKEDEETEKEMSKKIKGLQTAAVALANESEPARNIPYHDISADTPEKAYPLDKIISKGEWDILKNDLERKLSADGKLFSGNYPLFVCKRAEKLREIEDETERETLGVILLYMTHLIKFKDQQSIDHRDSAKFHSIPGMIFQKFRNKFMDEKGDEKKKRHEVSGPKNDLLIGHVLVLSLFVDGFNSDPTDLSQDLRIVKTTLRTHYLNLGCKMKIKNGQPACVTLPVPLKFPALERRERRKKKKN